MGVLQKAYTFVKKHWSTDDDVYPDDLNRYEDGIEELYNRATDQDKQINVLSETKVDKNKDNITEKGLTIDTWLTIDGDTSGRASLLCNLYNDNDGNYRYANTHPNGSGSGFRTSIFEKTPKYIYAMDSSATKDAIANIVEVDLATTTKTDISYTLNGGLTFRSDADSKGEYTDTLASIRMIVDVNNVDIFNWNFVWCTLPPQLRPRHQLSDILLASNTGIVSITILSNGDIIRGNLMPQTKPTWIMGYVPMYGRNV